MCIQITSPYMIFNVYCSTSVVFVIKFVYTIGYIHIYTMALANECEFKRAVA